MSSESPTMRQECELRMFGTHSNRFFRGKEGQSIPWTGLGLSIVKRVDDYENNFSQDHERGTHAVFANRQVGSVRVQRPECNTSIGAKEMRCKRTTSVALSLTQRQNATIHSLISSAVGL
jgi:hypothetical protein